MKINVIGKMFVASLGIVCLNFSPTGFCASSVETPTTSGPSFGSGGGTPSVNQGAGKTQGGNSSGNAMSLAMGGAELAGSAAAFASQNYGLGAMLAAMGAMSLMQGAEHGKTSGQAGETGGASFGGAFGGAPKLPKDMANKYQLDNGEKMLGDIKNGKFKGIAIDGKGNVLLNGKVVDGNDPGASFAAAGMKKGDIDAAMAKVASIEKDVIKDAAKLGAAATKANGYDEGGSGGSYGGGFTPPAAPPESGSANAKGSDRALVKRDPAALAGLTKDFHGNPIGIASDNLFDMMTRRYKAFQQRNSFYDTHELNFK